MRNILQERLNHRVVAISHGALKVKDIEAQLYIIGSKNCVDTIMEEASRAYLNLFELETKDLIDHVTFLRSWATEAKQRWSGALELWVRNVHVTCSLNIWMI